MSFVSSKHHSFDMELAIEYGIDCAIMIHHFQHWVSVNKRRKKNFHEGRTWTYQTLDDIAAHFPYWTKSHVFDVIEKLCTGKSRYSKKDELDFSPVLMKGDFNQKKFDRTIWYSFIDEKMFTILGKPKMEIEEPQNGDCGTPTPIPDTKTDTKERSSSPKSSPPQNPTSQESLKEEMMKRTLCTDKEFEGAWQKYEEADYEIPYVKAWLEKVISEEIAVRQEEGRREEETESVRQRQVQESMNRLLAGYYD